MISVSIVTYHSDTSELDACLASLGNPLVKKYYSRHGQEGSGVRK